MAPASGLDDASIEDAEALALLLGAHLDTGLTAAEAARRLSADGPNELRPTPPRPPWRRLLSQFQDPLIYLLLVAVAIALLAWGFEGRAGWPIDAIVIAAVVALNGAIGFAQEAKAHNAVAALARMTTATSTVRRDGQPVRIPSARLVRGDLLALGEGDAVGADARLVRCASTKRR